MKHVKGFSFLFFHSSFLTIFFFYKNVFSVLPSILNIISMVPYFIVAGLDTAGYREIAEILHYVFVAIDPPYGFLYYLLKYTLNWFLLFSQLFFFFKKKHFLEPSII